MPLLFIKQMNQCAFLRILTQDLSNICANAYFFGGTLDFIGMIDPEGTTTSLLFLGFFVSLLPRICPLAMVFLLKLSALK